MSRFFVKLILCFFILLPHSHGTTSSFKQISSEIARGDEMNLLTIHSELEKIGRELQDSWSADSFRKVVVFYPEIFKRMVHHGSVESIAPLYRERASEIDEIISELLDKDNQLEFHYRMKAALVELEQGNG
jgi:F0F1-type ATP synthase gamma subunit